MGPAGASPLISADVAAQLLATAEQDGTSALMAALNAACGLAPPKAPPAGCNQQLGGFPVDSGAVGIDNLAVEQHSQFQQDNVLAPASRPQHAMQQPSPQSVPSLTQMQNDAE